MNSTYSYRSWCWIKEHWKEIIPIFLTLAIVILTGVIAWQGYEFHKLNKNIEDRNIEILQGKQIILVHDTRNFLLEYITNFTTYLVYEKNKFIRTPFNNRLYQAGTDPNEIEKPGISRKFYVSSYYSCKLAECIIFTKGGWPEYQNKVDSYFASDPTLDSLKGGILSPVQTSEYLKLKGLIDIFNRDFIKYATSNIEFEEYYVKRLLKDSSKEKINWETHFIYDKYDLVQSIKEIKTQGDKFINLFNELEIQPTKFVAIIKSSKPFMKISEEQKDKPFTNNINPIDSATINLNDNLYEFDYFKYFTIDIERKYKKHKEDTDKRQQASENQNSYSTYYKLINK